MAEDVRPTRKMATTAFSSFSEVLQGNPVRTGNCPATVKGTKAMATVPIYRDGKAASR
jgi:hypothetical protein